MYRDALSTELQSARYCVVKKRVLERERGGGTDAAIEMLELAATGEAVNSDTGAAEPTLLSPPMLQYVWGTHQADAVDAEIDFLSDYVASAWPRLLSRVVSRHLSLDLATCPVACRR